MNRLLVRCGVASLFALLMAGPAWGQKTGNPAPPAQPSGPLAGSAGPNVATPSPSREMPTPIYVRGRVLMETGQPVPEPVSVGLSCGMRTLQVVHTDPKGYFQFTLGAGPQSNIDMSASEDTSMGDLGTPGMTGPFGDTDSNMMGCELNVSVG